MTEYLIRPFSGMHARGTPERTFNTRHSSARGIIENTLGIHSSRFRVLEGPIPLAPEKVKVVDITSRGTARSVLKELQCTNKTFQFNGLFL